MRSAILLVVFLVPVSCQGDVNVGYVAHTINPHGATELDGRVSFGESQSGPPGSEWIIPNLTAANVGQFYSVTEQTAAAQGFEWGLAETYWMNTLLGAGTVRAGTIIDNTLTETTKSIMGSLSPNNNGLEQIDFRILFWNDQSLRVQAEVYYLTPEPSTLLIALLAPAAVARVRLSRG